MSYEDMWADLERLDADGVSPFAHAGEAHDGSAIEPFDPDKVIDVMIRESAGGDELKERDEIARANEARPRLIRPRRRRPLTANR